jgi:hypothetical protein
MNKLEFIKLVTDNVKTKQWLNCTVPVTLQNTTFNVGIKTYGKWIQRIELCGIVESIPEQKTNNALSAELTKLLDYVESRL